MQPLDFLAAVLPSSGLYCVAEFTTPKKEHVFVNDLQGVVDAGQKFVDGKKDAYFALANFKEAGKRTADNAKSLKALFIDIDIGEGKDYADRAGAIAAYEKFMEDTGMATLGQPIIVSSGGGFHIYWPFDEEVPVDQWKPVAENFKRLCKQEGFNIDWNCTADAARVLRIPGTYNHKKEKPRAVKIVQEGDVFTLFAIDSHIKSKLKAPTYEATVASLPGKKPKAAQSTSLKLLSENNETYFKVIFKKTKEGVGCGQLAHYIENATSEGMEPLWRGLLSITQKCADGDKAGAWLSSMHPYEPERMVQKLREIKGPYPCLKFDSENPGICTECPHFGKITNPLALGRTLVTDNAPKQIELTTPPQSPDAEPVVPKTVERPAAPRGFSYGKNGAIFKDVKMEDADGNSQNKQVMVLEYPLFAVNILEENDEHTVHMIAMHPHGTKEVTLPQRAVVSKDETVKRLAEQNVVAAYGQLNDKNLADYVRACVNQASLERRAIKVPDSYGWQEDNSFVYSEHIFTKDDAPRHVPMQALHNLNHATRASGSLNEWRRVIHMLINRKQWNVLSMAMVGFAAPLMAFTKYKGMTFHLGSEHSGTGKSLALELAASIWGDPINFQVNKSTSDVAMIQRLGLLNSLPLISDELTQKNRDSFEWVASFIFDMSAGLGKDRMEAGSNKERKNTTHWSSLCLISSNTNIADWMTGARIHSSQGEMRRFLEWEAQKEDIITWTPAERDLLDIIKTNHGVAGPQYVQFLVENREAVKNTVQQAVALVEREMKLADHERFWMAGCGCVIAACLLVGKEHSNIVNVPVQPILDFLHHLVKRSRQALHDNIRTAEDVLNSYTQEFYGKFVVVKAMDGALVSSLGEDGMIDMSLTKSQVAGRIEHGVTPGHIDYYIEEKLLKGFCSKHSFSYAAFKKEMEANFHVSYTKKDLMSKTKGPPMRVNAIRISQKISETEPPVSLAAA